MVAKGAAKAMASGTVRTKVQQPLKDAGSRTNVLVKAPALDKVVEEEDGEPAVLLPSEQRNSSVVASIETTEATMLQPKKKKLLGGRKNIFDNDEPDNVKKPGLGKIKLGLGKNKPKMLAEFSPLKKDRRTLGVVV